VAVTNRPPVINPHGKNPNSQRNSLPVAAVPVASKKCQ
jgi:hypothetical protein